jgi:hypothetical protein
VDDTLDELKEANFITHLDLVHSLWQVQVHEEDTHETTFETHYGLMEYGMCNALMVYIVRCVMH